MKKFLVVLAAVMLLVSTVSAAFAGYADYYSAKAAAKTAMAQGDVNKAAEMYLTAYNEASVLAAMPDMKLPWKLYAERQDNNAAIVYIDSFKKDTNWEADMEALKAIPNGPERLTAMNKLYDKARVHVTKIETAKQKLKSREITKAEVLAKAKSNHEFCDWVLEAVK